MSKHKEDSYIFCAAIVRAGEKDLLPEADLVKAAQAKTFEEAMAVVSEHGYGDGKALENPRDFVKVLAQAEAEAYQFVFSVLPDGEELALLKCQRDYHNAKAILKADALRMESDPYLIQGGSVDPKAMEAMIRERNTVFLSSEMKDGIAEALEIFGKGQDPQEIDIILDRACYKEMFRRAEALENKFMLGYVRLLIDILNVSAFVRLRQMGKPWAFFQKVFLEGGLIQQSLFVASYEESYRQLGDRFGPYGFQEVMEKGAAQVGDTGSYSLLEKLCDDMRIEYIKDAKFISFGFEPAAAYLIAKESEIKNLRMILTGKIAGTSEEVILERLRKAYV